MAARGQRVSFDRRNTFGYVGASGERLVSVSEALKLAGLVNLSHIPPDILETARQRGQDVHSWIEGLALGLIDDEIPDPRIAPYIEAYRHFLDDTRFLPLDAELGVVSKLYRFSGRLDLRGTIGDDYWILDAKATAAVPPESSLQVAGYAIALREDEKRAEQHRRGVLHLMADARYRLHEFKGRDDEHDFLACVRVASWKLRNGLGRVED